MKLTDFDYNLPKALIAQTPKEPRDHSRLLILNKETGKTEDKHFYDIIEYLKKGDVLVMNNSKVFPARLIGQRKETGGKFEVFLLRSMLRNKDDCHWQCLVGGKRARIGLAIEFGDELYGELKKDNKDSTWEVEFNMPYEKMIKVVEKVGETPLPPYIKSQRDCRVVADASPRNDRKNYQTLYADNDKVGSVAAPTAGFHFTPELIKKIKEKGVQIEYITLHVGLGTFAPVKVDDITKHKMHAEFVEVDEKVIEAIRKAKKEKRRIVAVGTTSVRTLEAISDVILEGVQRPIESRRVPIGPFSRSRMTGFSDFVNIFIYPGYKFKIVDGLITNFHLPKSTLLMLVSAFSSKENINKAYQHAIKNNYRFYSYGDAMLIF